MLADILLGDRIVLIMNFGASCGPWIIYKGALQMGCCCFAADARDAKARSNRCDSFYQRSRRWAKRAVPASHFAKENHIDPATLGIKKIISFGKNDWKFDALLPGGITREENGLAWAACAGAQAESIASGQ